MILLSNNAYCVPSTTDEIAECILGNKKHVLEFLSSYITTNEKTIDDLKKELNKSDNDLQKHDSNKRIRQLNYFNEKIQEIINQQINMCWPLVNFSF